MGQVSADSGGDITHLIVCVAEVLERREVCRAFYQVPPPLPCSMKDSRWIYRSWTASLPCALRASFPRIPFFYPSVRRPIRRFGMPSLDLGLGFLALRCASGWMRAGNGRVKCGRNCVRREELNHYFNGVGAHPWILERRNGPARGIYNCAMEDCRFSGEQILAEAHWCLNTLTSAGRYSAYQTACGSNAAGLFLAG